MAVVQACLDYLQLSTPQRLIAVTPKRARKCSVSKSFSTQQTLTVRPGSLALDHLDEMAT